MSKTTIDVFSADQRITTPLARTVAGEINVFKLEFNRLNPTFSFQKEVGKLIAEGLNPQCQKLENSLLG